MAGAALVAASVPGVAFAAADDCRVVNVGTTRACTALEDALFDARPGARLTLRGQCAGPVTVARGVRIRGVRAAGSGAPRIDAATGPVVAVDPGVRLTLRGITIGGATSSGGDAAGLAIGTGAAVRLFTTSVVDTTSAGGAAIVTRGTLRIEGASVIHGNTSDASAGGIDILGGRTTIAGTALLTENTGKQGGAVRVRTGGTLVIGASARKRTTGAGSSASGR